MLCGVQEIGASQMLVPLCHAGVDGGGVNYDLRRGLGDVLLVEMNFPRDFFENPPHVGNHEMTHLELNSRVRGIELRREEPGETQQRP